jgi:hypothetical protein
MFDNRTQKGWDDFVAIWVVSLLTFMLWLFANIVLGVVIGAIAGWMLSHSLLGQWITDGLNVGGIKTNIGELYKIGAAAGFLSGFLKFSFSPWKRK